MIRLFVTSQGLDLTFGLPSLKMKRLITYKNRDTEKSAKRQPKLRVIFYVLTLHLILTSLNCFGQFTKLLDFGSKANGYLPYSSLISDGTFLYGMTSEGGANDKGTIYKIKPDGTGFVKLLDFSGANGSNPKGSLKLIGTTLYGMTLAGGANGQGIIFKINSDGTGFADLFDFSYTATGAYPYGSLISDGTFLYGMTYQGGLVSYGTIFKIKPDGTGFTKLLDFNGTNGGYPYGSLILEGSSLYGMTSDGGSNNLGTVFKINTDGTGFSKILDFTGTANGASPWGSLISDGTFLYGMTQRGGASNFGTIFKIKPDNTGYSKLLDFDNSTKGAYPKGSLAFSTDFSFLFGMTTDYGLNGRGTIFKIKTDGTGYVKLLDNDVGTNGPNPEGTPLVIGLSIYGVKSGLGAGSAPFPPGTIFKINTDGTGYSKLFSFEIEGNSPSGSLYSDGTFQYGMTSKGGRLDYGTIFKIKPDGTGYIRLLDFDDVLKGSYPKGSLISDGVFLYGMTTQGGINGAGTIFKIKPDGTSFARLFDFAYATSGGASNGSLIFDGAFLYGMTGSGASSFYGAIFKIKPDGTGFAKLLDFDGINGGTPNGSLISDGTFLYGMSASGGTDGFGSIFKIKPDGSGFLKLLDFDYANNGSNPKADLLYDGTFLYGMTSSGGPTANGTVFKIKPDGTAYAKLLDFDGNNKGGSPYGSLISDGTFLYGMTYIGGGLNFGTIFRIKPDATGYSKLLDLNDGRNPQGSLISDGTFLYGMTNGGGSNASGTFFKSSLIPFTTITDFHPAEGVEGTFVTINGNNFDPTPANNILKFNGSTAVVTSGTTTTLTAFVPVGATSGPISVTAFGTDISIDDFNVTTKSEMINGSIKNCNFSFLPPTYTYIAANSYKDIIETLIPVNPADKVKITFSTFDVSGGDVLYVYDGPSSTSPLLATLQGISTPPPIIATGAGGELTFVYSWGDGTTIWNANISCQSAGGPSITITTQPSDFIACVGQTATFTTAATGTTNITYQWQYSPNTSPLNFADINNGGGYSNTKTAILSVNTTGNFGAGRYRCKINGDLATTVFTNDEGLFVNPVPAAPTVVPASRCGNGSLTLSASGGVNGQYKWYTAATGGTPITGEVNNTYATPSLSVTTTYYVTLSIGGCESTRTSVIATINTLPPTPMVAEVSVCPNSAATFNATGGTNGQYKWYTVPTGGSAITGEVNGIYTTALLSTATTYYVTVTIAGCESARASAVAIVLTTGCSPLIATATQSTQVEGKVEFDLNKLITTPGVLDPNSIKIIKQPTSGAVATITNSILTIDYKGKPFMGTESIIIEACNTNGLCSQQTFTIEVAGDVVVYNAVSPNGDDKNEFLYLKYIDVLAATKANKVFIYNRWGDEVFSVANYDNQTRVFAGFTIDGGKLPAGTYFYKIVLPIAGKTLTGFIDLKY